ncbi:hypothetical protein LXL04_007689 [Taraxacum kok-saghyz]
MVRAPSGARTGVVMAFGCGQINHHVGLTRCCAKYNDKYYIFLSHSFVDDEIPKKAIKSWHPFAYFEIDWELFICFLDLFIQLQPCLKNFLAKIFKRHKSGSSKNSYWPENLRTHKPVLLKNFEKNAPKKSCIYPKKQKGCINAKIKNKISFLRKNNSANYNDYERFGGSRRRFFERNNGLGDIGLCQKVEEISESRSFENSYIPENPRTPKPLTFSKNRLRGAKNRSNISPVAKKNFRKNDFFFSKNFAYVQTFFLSLYNTYLKRFVKKNLKKNAKKKSCTYAQKIKKSCTYAKVKKKYRFFGNFFQRIVMIKNVLEGSEVGFLKGITVWEI